VRDLAPSPTTTVVVNCAGRTRSIIGAQSLINAGVPNKVVALRNGTMGWNLAGLTCDSGQTRRAPDASADGLAWARSAAARVADRFGADRIDAAGLERLRGDSERTLYLFDVRDPAEYAAGHVAGSASAPGGQLVQATDQYVGTLGARIVLVDDKEVRALMTASWLRQMGFREVFVLAQAGDERGTPVDDVPGLDRRPDLAIDASVLADLVARNAATIIDLSLSRSYRRGHIAGAWFAIRARLKEALAAIPARECFVLTSEDSRLADLAAPELAALTERPVRYLKGGNAAWQAAGHALTAVDAHMADEPVDVWLRPYERAGGVREGMIEYLTWETDLPERIARDGTADFVRYRP
jgi:rhodanese-related sulfurtransferase